MLLSVFSQGDKGTSWYIIWKGSVNVVTHGKVSLPSLPSPLGCNCSLVLDLTGSAFKRPKATDLPGLLLLWWLCPPWVCPGEGWAAGLGCDSGLAAGPGDHTA